MDSLGCQGGFKGSSQVPGFDIAQRSTTCAHVGKQIKPGYTQPSCVSMDRGKEV
jgi:hypothetical protein